MFHLWILLSGHCIALFPNTSTHPHFCHAERENKAKEEERHRKRERGRAKKKLSRHKTSHPPNFAWMTKLPRFSAESSWARARHEGVQLKTAGFHWIRYTLYTWLHCLWCWIFSLDSNQNTSCRWSSPWLVQPMQNVSYRERKWVLNELIVLHFALLIEFQMEIT